MATPECPVSDSDSDKDKDIIHSGFLTKQGENSSRV